MTEPLWWNDPPDAPLTLSDLLALSRLPGIGGEGLVLLARAQREALFAIAWDREHPPTFFAWLEVLDGMERALLCAAREASSGEERVSEPRWPTSYRDYPALCAFRWDASSPPTYNAWTYVWFGITGGQDCAELGALRRQARAVGAPEPDCLPTKPGRRKDRLPTAARARRAKP